MDKSTGEGTQYDSKLSLCHRCNETTDKVINVNVFLKLVLLSFIYTLTYLPVHI